jgi:hypothetical protein
MNMSRITHIIVHADSLRLAANGNRCQRERERARARARGGQGEGGAYVSQRKPERERGREGGRGRETCNIVKKRASSIDSSDETVLQGVDLLVGAYVVVAQILVVNNVGFALALHLMQLNVNHALSLARARSLSRSLCPTHTHTCMSRVNETD